MAPARFVAYLPTDLAAVHSGREWRHLLLPAGELSRCGDRATGEPAAARARHRHAIGGDEQCDPRELWIAYLLQYSRAPAEGRGRPPRLAVDALRESRLHLRLQPGRLSAVRRSLLPHAAADDPLLPVRAG